MSYLLNTRKKRGLQQRMFLLDLSYDDGVWSFSVKGMTNTYKLLLNSNLMMCNCIDFETRNSVCKHLYFIIGRIAGLQLLCDKLENNPLHNGGFPSLRQTDYKLLSKTLKARLRERYQAKDETSDEEVEIKINLSDDRECPICYEDINPKVEKISQCEKQCKKYFHQSCILLWLQMNSSCPLCRIKINKSEIDPTLASVMNPTATHDPLQLFDHTKLNINNL